jgi:hypothetical protein
LPQSKRNRVVERSKLWTYEHFISRIYWQPQYDGPWGTSCALIYSRILSFYFTFRIIN